MSKRQHSIQTRDAARWGRRVERSTVSSYPCLVYTDRPRSVAELLVDARRWDGRTFLVEGERHVGYREHEAAVARTARLLAGQGIRRGDRVLLLSFNRLEWVVAFWALQCLGATAVLGNAWWSDAETRAVLESVDPAAVLSDRSGEAAFGQRAVVSLEKLRSSIVATDAIALEPVDVAEDDPSLIMYSSGTTGAPKGVVMSHRSVIANIQNLLVLTDRLPSEMDPSAPGTVSLLTMPLFHLAGIQISISTLLSGGRLVLLPGRFGAEAVLRLIATEKVRVWGAVPTMVSRVMSFPRLRDFDLSSLRSIPMGGAAVSPELRAKISAALPRLQMRVGSLYGLTEAGGVLAAASGAELEGRPHCVGRPLPVVELRIADADAAGVGEICARTPSATSGYWGESVPLADVQGWVRTGDLGRIDGEGRLYVVGRSKDIIIRGGENVASIHVERCLLKHPSVLECAVVPLPHADLGEEVGAVLVIRPDARVDAEDLRRYAAAKLARFEVPSRWWLRRAPLPTNASGKTLKRELIYRWQDAPCC